MQRPSSKYFLLLKKVIRLITKQSHYAHTNELFHHCGILKIADIHKYLLAIEAYKTFHSQNFRYPEHSYHTRHASNPIPSFQRLSSTQRSLSFSLPSVWNELPNNVQNSTNLREFKSRCKSYLISKYAE